MYVDIEEKKDAENRLKAYAGGFRKLADRVKKEKEGGERE